MEKEICTCLYYSERYWVEMIQSPSGKEVAIGGINDKDRWKFCPWCGGSLKRSS